MNNLYKIGMTTDPVNRLYDLQAGNPMLFVAMEHWVDDPATAEENLHQMFSSKLYSREVFSLSDNDLKTIKDFLGGLHRAFEIRAEYIERKTDKDKCYLNVVGKGIFDLDNGNQLYDIEISSVARNGGDGEYAFALCRKPGYILYKIANKYAQLRTGKREYCLSKKDIESIGRMATKLSRFG